MQHDIAEGVAALVLVVGGLIFTVTSVRRHSDAGGGSLRRGMRANSTDAAASGLVWFAAASCSLGAAVIHFALAPAHLAELGALGAGFLLAGVLQAGMAVLIAIRRSELVAWAAVWLNLVLIVAWAWTRTVGLPVGDDPGHPEAIGRGDFVAVALETAVVAPLLVWIRGRRLGKPDLPNAYASIGIVPAVGIVALLTILALAGPGEGHNHGILLMPGLAAARSSRRDAPHGEQAA